jgi:hypothetical protein
VINAAVREGSPLFGTQELEDELEHLVRGFVGIGVSPVHKEN